VELRHLRYFLAVAEELSFRKAAERLHLAQPPLSAQIKGLEEELGAKLFERTTRSVRLTQAGRVLLEEARIVLAAAERAEQRIRKADLGLIGTLRIGVIRPAANDRLAAILRRFRDHFSGVQLILRDLASTEQLEALRKDELDLGLLRPPLGFPELDFVFLEESPMVLATSTDHPLARKRRLEWKDFDKQPLVMMHPTVQHGYYDGFLAACARCGATPYPYQYTHDVSTKLWLISAGFGIAPTTATVAESGRPGLVLRDLPPDRPMVPTIAVWKRGTHSPALESFKRFLIEGFSDVSTPSTAPPFPVG
jgi:DNA-binding transcriptional LysR family regulator